MTTPCSIETCTNQAGVRLTDQPLCERHHVQKLKANRIAAKLGPKVQVAIEEHARKTGGVKIGDSVTVDGHTITITGYEAGQLHMQWEPKPKEPLGTACPGCGRRRHDHTIEKCYLC